MVKLMEAGWTFSGSRWVLPAETPNSEVKVQESSDPFVCVLTLPVEIMSEVFHFLDSVNIANCRRVSMLWNCVLTQDQYSKEIRVTFPTTRVPIVVASSIWKRLTITTERIIIRNAFQKDRFTDFVHCLRFIHAVRKVQAPGRRLTVIFVQCVWTMAKCFNQEIRMIADTGADVTSTVATVIWKNCMVSPISGHFGYTRAERLSYGLWNLDSSDLCSDLWRTLEAAFPTLCTDPASLTAWIQETVLQENVRDRNRIQKVLRDFQNGDGREGIRYRGTSWTADELRCLDVSTLTKLTQNALQRLMYERHSGVKIRKAAFDGI